MAAKKGELVREDGLVPRPVVDIEMIDSPIGAELTEWGPTRGCDRGPRRGDPVGLANANEPRAMQLGGMTGRPIRTAEQPSRRNPIAPARILADLNDMAPTNLTTWCVDERGLAWLPDGGQMSVEGSREQDAGADPQR